ncbi:MAG: HD domain-containing protein [Clostridiales bacterium]|nr:HD domain-containing protein [Clostridiales bacterium]
MKAYPGKAEALRLLRQAETMNPGLWVDHCLVVANCAEKIALACGNMDGEKAWVLGLLHDIGRRAGVFHLRHVYEGYMYMLSLGYPDAAKICLTHSFSVQKLEDYIGKHDVTPDQRQTLESALAACEYDDYDRLIQLCDSIGMATGAATLEERMGDVKRRYGWYPQDKWDKNYELKAYFEQKAGRSIDEITAGIGVEG